LSQAKHKIRHQQPITRVNIEFILIHFDIFSVTAVYDLLSQLRELYYDYYKCTYMCSYDLTAFHERGSYSWFLKQAYFQFSKRV